MGGREEEVALKKKCVLLLEGHLRKTFFRKRR